MNRKVNMPIGGPDRLPVSTEGRRPFTGRKLFFKRYKTELKYQAGVIRSVLDWTIWVYMVIPGLVIGGFMYAEAWQEPPGGIPLWLVIAALLLTSIGGNIRTMLEEPDLLFLLQQRGILRQMKRHAYIHSIIQALCATALFIVLALPLLSQKYMMAPFKIGALFISIFAVKISVLTIKKRIVNRYFRFAVILVALLAAAAFLLRLPFGVNGIFGTILAVLLLLYNWSGTGSNHSFFRDIEIEAAEWRKWTGMILHFSPEVENLPSRQKKRPILFPYSERIFNKRSPENGLLEIVLKSFFRNWNEVGSVLQMTSITCFAFVAMPLLFKWGIYLAFLLFLNIWLESSFKRLTESPFFQAVPYDQDIKYSVWPRFRKIIIIPLAILLGLLAGAASFL